MFESLANNHNLCSVKRKIVTFERDPSYEIFNATGDVNKWKSVLPANHGFLSIEHPERYNLSGGFPMPRPGHDAPPEDDKNLFADLYGKDIFPVPPNNYTELYALGVFHQLHCLAGLQHGFMRILDLAREETINGTAIAWVVEHASHNGHCLDYLRQSVMCSGDLTLEKAAVFHGLKRQFVEGWGNEHECVDWEELWQYVDTGYRKTLESYQKPAVFG